MIANEVKKLVGYFAVDGFIRSGMRVGLGTGSTAFFAVERIGQKLKSGELSNLICVPTSEATRKQAEEWNIPLTNLNDAILIRENDKYALDVTIDGADEVDMKSYNLIKGGGGALLREKMTEKASRAFVCIVDEGKCKSCPSSVFGTCFAVPVEITQFSYLHVIKEILQISSVQGTGCVGVLRMKGSDPYVTDNGNYIVDLKCEHGIQNVAQFANELTNIVGVVEHGVFIDMVSVLLVGNADGSVSNIAVK